MTHAKHSSELAIAPVVSIHVIVVTADNAALLLAILRAAFNASFPPSEAVA